ncbi:MAG: hypothetical protein IT434_17345 [Phycisphaerales bacterium]|nr:hypothetical protein [Phycisphaerales bacterium]
MGLNLRAWVYLGVVAGVAGAGWLGVDSGLLSGLVSGLASGLASVAALSLGLLSLGLVSPGLASPGLVSPGGTSAGLVSTGFGGGITVLSRSNSVTGKSTPRYLIVAPHGGSTFTTDSGLSASWPARRRVPSLNHTVSLMIAASAGPP